MRLTIISMFLTSCFGLSTCAPAQSELVIAVPQCSESKTLVRNVEKIGCKAVTVSSTTDSSALRIMAAGWDGAAIPDGWVSENDEFSVLFYKTVADWNIPHTGASAVSEELDRVRMRIDGSLLDEAALCAKGATFHHAKELMDGILSIDGHGDLPCCYEDGCSLGKRLDNQINLPKMEEGHLSSCIAVSYVGQKGLDEESSRKAFELCDGLIDQTLADIEQNSSRCGFARTEEEALALKASGKKAIFLAVENAYALGTDIRNVEHFAKRGVTYMTLSHMSDNAVCHSSTHSEDTTKGLTPFGREVVRELNRCGVIVDVSHTSSGTFWDCIELSTAPIICSHSGAKSVFDHDRNLTDDQLRALAAKGGLVMVYIVQDYMAPKQDKDKVGINEMMDHLLHCIRVAGIDHVGISCDFDGGGGGWGLNGDNDVINITVRLLEDGFSDEDITKLWSSNFFRVLNAVQAM